MQPARKSARLRLLLSVALLLLTARAARAQDIGPALDMTLMTGWSANAAITYDLQKRAAEARRTGIADRPATASAARSASFAYVPTPALKQKTVQNYVAHLQPKSPAAAQAVATTFGPGKYDYGTIYRGLIDGYDLRENDAASALAAYMVLGYMVVNNVQTDKQVTPAMVRGVRTQLLPLLSKNARLSAPGVPAQLGEEMKLQCVVVQGGWQSAGKAGTLPAYQQNIAAMFKNQYGLDMTQVKLTDQGFAKR